MRNCRTALILLTVIWLAACAGAQSRTEPLAVTLSDVAPGQMGLFEQEFALKIRVQNPNDFEIPVAGLSFDVDLNGKPFARGVSRQSTSVPAFGEVMLDVKAVSTLGGILQQVSALRSGPPERITYRLRGKLAQGGGQSIPFDSIGKVDLGELTGGSDQ